MTEITIQTKLRRPADTTRTGVLRQTIKFVVLSTCLLCCMSLVSKVQAYEVWLGCTKIPKTAVTRPEVWENARQVISGTNLNLTGFVKKNLGNPIVKGEENLRKKDWRVFFDRMPGKAKSGIRPIPRSHITNKYFPDKPSIEEKLLSVFNGEDENYGYEIAALLPYSSRPREDQKYDPLNFSNEEFAVIRRWLNTHENGKYKHVKIIDNIRLFRKSDFLKQLPQQSGLIDAYMFEAAPEKFYDDRGNRQDMLKTFITHPQLGTKDIIFQIPISPWDYEDEKGATNFQILRNFLVWLGETYGYEFLKSDRTKFLITTYNPTVPFYPELSTDKSQYQNTITGMILSLVEQEPLFTGELRKPTRADAYSYDREISASAPSGSAETVATAERVWTDASGRHRIRATLVRFQSGRVTLRQANGAVHTLSINQLSRGDRIFLSRVQ